MKFLSISLTVLLIGLGFFLYHNHFETSKLLNLSYFSWDKTVIFLLVFGYSFFLKTELSKKIIYIISIFLFLRICWQMFEFENYVLANKPYIIDLLFITDILTIIIIFLMSKKNDCN